MLWGVSNEHYILKSLCRKDEKLWVLEMGSVFAFMPHCLALNLLQIAFENEGQSVTVAS